MAQHGASATMPLAFPDGESLFRGLGLAPYEWDIGSDQLVWSADPAGLARIGAAELPSGRAWESLIVAGSGLSRAGAILGQIERDSGAGVPYASAYAIRRRDGSSLLVEDRGRWFAGPSGRPERALGVVRRLGEQIRDAAPSGTWPAPAMTALQRALDRAADHAGSRLLLLLDPCVAREDWDEAARHMLRRLRRVMRQGDSVMLAPDGLVAVVLAGRGADGAREAAARLVAAASGGRPDWRIHVGACPIGSALNAAEALRRAGAALPQADTPGAEGFALYRRRALRPARPSTQREALRVLNALNGRDIVLGLRPAVTASRRASVWETALPLLRRGKGRYAPLRAALPRFQADGIAALVEHRCLELALAHLRERSAGRLRLPVSPAAIACRSWRLLLASVLAEEPARAKRLLLDLDEAVFAALAPTTVEGLADLRDQGVGLMVSGFGRGHASFARIAQAGCAAVAVSEALIAGLTRSSDMRFVLKSLIAPLRDLGVTLAADGVPDEETASLAASLGVHVLGGEIAGELRVAEPRRPRTRAAA